MKSFLGNFYRHLAIFIWSHCQELYVSLTTNEVALVRKWHVLNFSTKFWRFLSDHAGPGYHFLGKGKISVALPISCYIGWTGKGIDFDNSVPKRFKRSYFLLRCRPTNLRLRIFNGIPGLFFFIFVFSIQLTVNIVQFKFLSMTGFEPRTSGIRSDRSTNCATTPAPKKHRS